MKGFFFVFLTIISTYLDNTAHAQMPDLPGLPSLSGEEKSISIQDVNEDTQVIIKQNDFADFLTADEAASDDNAGDNTAEDKTTDIANDYSTDNTQIADDVLTNNPYAADAIAEIPAEDSAFVQEHTMDNGQNNFDTMPQALPVTDTIVSYNKTDAENPKTNVQIIDEKSLDNNLPVVSEYAQTNTPVKENLMENNLYKEIKLPESKLEEFPDVPSMEDFKYKNKNDIKIDDSVSQNIEGKVEETLGLIFNEEQEVLLSGDKSLESIEEDDAVLRSIQKAAVDEVVDVADMAVAKPISTIASDIQLEKSDDAEANNANIYGDDGNLLNAKEKAKALPFASAKKKITNKYESVSFSEQQLIDLMVVAAANGDLEAVKSIIHSGRDLDAKNTFGQTALIAAANTGSNEVVEYLVSQGANPNKQDSQGNTPLHFAVVKNSTFVSSLLINSGADVNLANNNGDTPLSYAIAYENVNLAKLILQAGGDINKKNSTGISAYEVAEAKKMLPTLALQPKAIDTSGVSEYYQDITTTQNSELYISDFINDKNDSLADSSSSEALVPKSFQIKSAVNNNSHNDVFADMRQEAALANSQENKEPHLIDNNSNSNQHNQNDYSKGELINLNAQDYNTPTPSNNNSIARNSLPASLRMKLENIKQQENIPYNNLQSLASTSINAEPKTTSLKDKEIIFNNNNVFPIIINENTVNQEDTYTAINTQQSYIEPAQGDIIELDEKLIQQSDDNYKQPESVANYAIPASQKIKQYISNISSNTVTQTATDNTAPTHREAIPVHNVDSEKLNNFMVKDSLGFNEPLSQKVSSYIYAAEATTKQATSPEQPVISEEISPEANIYEETYSENLIPEIQVQEDVIYRGQIIDANQW